MISANQMLRSDEENANISNILIQLRAYNYELTIIHPPCVDGNDDTIIDPDLEQLTNTYLKEHDFPIN